MKQKLPSRGTLLKLIERSLDEGRDKDVIERLQWFLHYSTHGSVSKTCKEFGIARSTFYRWINRFDINNYETSRKPTTEIRNPILISRLAFLIALFLINIGVLLFALPTLASAASSWNPTLLVSTEAFERIDDSDTASDVYLEFGETLQERFMFKRNETVFATSRGLRVGGNLTATGAIASSGSITAEGVLSGASLHVSSLTTLSGAVSIEGNVTTSGTLVIDGTSNLQGVATFGTTVTITEGALTDDTIVEGDLKAVDAAADEDFLTYESTTGDFEWHSVADISAGIAADIAEGELADDIVVEGDLKAVDAASDEDVLTYESTTGDFEWHSKTDLGIGTATAITDGLIVEPDLDADVAAADGDWLQYDSTGTNFTWRSSAELLSDLGQNGGTDITADLEEETHASEHANGGGDAVDHDTLTNFAATEHVDWAGASAGTIHTDNYIEDDDTGVNEVYGVGWNADTDSPEKDDIYDYLIQLDTDADGDIDTLDPSVGGGGGLTQALADDRYVNQSGDTMTGALDVSATASGWIIHAQDKLTSSGAISVEGVAYFQNVSDSTTGFQIFDADGGTPIFNVDTTNERVGIGTASPARKVHVHVAGSGQADILHITNDDSGSTSADGTTIGIDAAEQFFIINRENKDLYFQAGGTEFMRMDSATGNVGIGDTGADSKLEVLDITAPQLKLTHTDGVDDVDFSIDSNGDFDVQISGDNFVIQNDTDGTTGVQVLDADGGTPIFNVDTTNERVGIGEATPDANLHITRTSGGDIAKFENSGQASALLISADAANSILLESGSNDSLQFGTNAGGADITIDSAGEVGIGSTDPSTALEITDGSGTWNIGGGDLQYNGQLDIIGSGKIEVQPSAGNQFKVASTSAGTVATLEGNQTSTAVNLENDTAANTSNEMLLNFKLVTSAQSRTAGAIAGSWSDITDASRTSMLAFKTTDTASYDTRVAIKGTDVGIGTTSPTARLMIAQSANETGALIDSEATNAPVLALDTVATPAQVANAPHILFGYRGKLDVKMYRSGTGALRIASESGVTLTLDSESSTATDNVMRIYSDRSTDENIIWRVQADGKTFADGAYSAAGADYAEWFPTQEENLESGELVCIDTDHDKSIKRCTGGLDDIFVGVISTDPGFVGGYQDTAYEGTLVLVGLVGQVMVNVSDEAGLIKRGDILTPSAVPGEARKATPWDTNHKGIALIAIENQTEPRDKIKVLLK